MTRSVIAAVVGLVLAVASEDANAQRYSGYGTSNRIGDYTYFNYSTPAGQVYGTSSRIGDYTYQDYSGAYVGYGISTRIGKTTFHNYSIRPRYRSYRSWRPYRNRYRRW